MEPKVKGKFVTSSKSEIMDFFYFYDALKIYGAPKL